MTDIEGLFEATMTATIGGEVREERAVYRGNPLTRSDAEVISGRDLVRGDNAVCMSSGGGPAARMLSADEGWIHIEQV